jgi:hypothetical protein
MFATPKATIVLVDEVTDKALIINKPPLTILCVESVLLGYVIVNQF